MSFNSEPIVQQVQTDFHNLLAFVTGPEARTQTAPDVTLTARPRLGPMARSERGDMADEITREVFEAEMPIVFAALTHCWTNSY